MIPRDLQRNLEYRRDHALWLDTPKRRKLCVERCRNGADGFIYWVNSFAWLIEPRTIKDPNTGKQLPKIIPFTSWPDQDKATHDIFSVKWQTDIIVEKGRGEGASWLLLMIILHQWMFEEMLSFGLVSHKVAAVDTPKDVTTLMPKLDWELDRLPKWMVPNYDRNLRDHTLRNADNHSMISGYPATMNLATGARLTCAFMDEFAKFPNHAASKAMTSTEAVTECRILASTPFGATGPYYKAAHDTSASSKKIRMHWSSNPTRNRGLYRVVGGLPMSVDPNNPLPSGYAEEWKNNIRDRLLERGYNILNNVRSPWYDARCLRPGSTPVTIAQEYDIDYIGSVSRFFSEALLDRLARGKDATVRPNRIRGELHFNTEEFKPKWIEAHDGRLRLWIELEGKQHRPPKKHYVVSCDIASGQGGTMSANSVAAITERDTGIKVGEYATNIMVPEDFANLVIALCWFFQSDDGPAYLIWEENGPGQNFRNQIFRMGFRNYYMRTVLDEGSRIKTRKAGWWTKATNKPALFGAYQYALQEGMFTNPCAEAIEECRKYERYPDGTVEFEGTIETDDANASKHVHGDRVIADALAWHAISEFSSGPKEKNVVKEPPESSFAARRKAYLRENEATNYW